MADFNTRAACEAAGWRWYDDNETLEAWCGERHGIAHAATVDGSSRHNDSVYDDWDACWAETVDGCLPDMAQAIDEGWCVIWSDSRGRWEIQRDDERATFVCDEDAVAHVIARAAAGSLYHQLVLDYCADSVPET